MNPTFHVKNTQTVIELPVHSDNLGRYKGSDPYFSKEERHCMIVPQPHGNYLKIHQQVRQCQQVEQGVQCDQETLNPPFCSEHLKSHLKLQVKESTIKEAGTGLFAYSPKEGRVFRKGEYIASFHGEILSQEQFRERYGAKYDKSDEKWFTPYAAQAGDTIIDAIIIRGIMAMANDCREQWRTNVCEKYDATEPHQIKCYANTDIYHDDELFISYGIAWWIAFPENLF